MRGRRRVAKKVKVPWEVFYNHCRFCPSRFFTITPRDEWVMGEFLPPEEREPVEIECNYLVWHTRTRCDHLREWYQKIKEEQRTANS